MRHEQTAERPRMAWAKTDVGHRGLSFEPERIVGEPVCQLAAVGTGVVKGEDWSFGFRLSIVRTVSNGALG